MHINAMTCHAKGCWLNLVDMMPCCSQAGWPDDLIVCRPALRKHPSASVPARGGGHRSAFVSANPLVTGVISGPRPDIPVATFNGCLGSILLTNFLYMLSQGLFMQRQGIYRRAECHHWNLWRATKGRWYQCMELRDHDAQVVSQNKCGTSNQ